MKSDNTAEYKLQKNLATNRKKKKKEDMHTSCLVDFIYRNIPRKIAVDLYRETCKLIHCTVVWNKEKLPRIFINSKGKKQIISI